MCKLFLSESHLNILSLTNLWRWNFFLFRNNWLCSCCIILFIILLSHSFFWLINYFLNCTLTNFLMRLICSKWWNCWIWWFRWNFLNIIFIKNIIRFAVFLLSLTLLIPPLLLLFFHLFIICNLLQNLFLFTLFLLFLLQ